MAPNFHNYNTFQHMQSWPPFQPTSGFGFDSRGSSPPDHSEIDLDPELCLKPLSKKSVEEVCQVLRTVDGMTSNRIDAYCDAVTSQNISGAVLSHCKIEELKTVLNMNFGDWELFQLVVLALRERERKMKFERKTLSLQPQSTSSSLPRRSPHPSGLSFLYRSRLHSWVLSYVRSTLVENANYSQEVVGSSGYRHLSLKIPNVEFF